MEPFVAHRIAQKIVFVKQKTSNFYIFAENTQERSVKTVSFKSARIRSGLSREEAAKEFGVTPDTIGHWERGDFAPPRKKLARVARFYGVTIKSLFDCEEIKKPKVPKRIRTKLELTDREKEVMTARMQGETFEEIGEKFGVSRQAAHLAFQAAMRKLSSEGRWANA